MPICPFGDFLKGWLIAPVFSAAPNLNPRPPLTCDDADLQLVLTFVKLSCVPRDFPASISVPRD